MNLVTALQEVTEGFSEVLPLRETDGRLGPLITSLIVLGLIALVLTIAYWFATRPKYQAASSVSQINTSQTKPKGTP